MRQKQGRSNKLLLTTLSKSIGTVTVHFRVYRHNASFVCEHETVERDGTSFTMTVPFTEVALMLKMLKEDPYYTPFRSELGRVASTMTRQSSSHSWK